MLPKTCVWLALLSPTAALAAQNFLLGVDYSERIPTGSLTNVNMLAAGTDSQGAVYLLVSGAYLMKLTGGRLLCGGPEPGWKTQLGL